MPGIAGYKNQSFHLVLHLFSVLDTPDNVALPVYQLVKTPTYSLLFGQLVKFCFRGLRDMWFIHGVHMDLMDSMTV